MRFVRKVPWCSLSSYQFLALEFGDTIASRWSGYDHLDSDLGLIIRWSQVTELIQMSVVSQWDYS